MSLQYNDWTDFFSKWGFDDGDAYPQHVVAIRDQVVEMLNKHFKDKWHFTPYDAGGIHNGVRIDIADNAGNEIDTKECPDWPEIQTLLHKFEPVGVGNWWNYAPGTCHDGLYIAFPGYRLIELKEEIPYHWPEGTTYGYPIQYVHSFCECRIGDKK